MTVITKVILKDYKAIEETLNIKTAKNEVSRKITYSKKLLSTSLFNDSKELVIEHQNEIYYLRITKQNKLILTK